MCTLFCLESLRSTTQRDDDKGGLLKTTEVSKSGRVQRVQIGGTSSFTLKMLLKATMIHNNTLLRRRQQDIYEIAMSIAWRFHLHCCCSDGDRDRDRDVKRRNVWGIETHCTWKEMQISIRCSLRIRSIF